MSEPRQVANLMRDALNALYKRRTRQVPGLIGDGTTEERVIVTGATQRVWFRPDPYPNALWQPIHLSGAVPLLHDMAAIVEFNETDGEWYVQQIDRKKYAEQEGLDLRYLPAHASQHAINEDSIPSDPVWVYRRAMAMLRGSPPGDGTLRVYVQSGDLPYTGSPYFSGTYTADLTSYLPSAGNQKWLTISVTSAAAIDINAGSEFAEGLSGINAPPDADDGAVPICHVLLSDDTSTITEAEIWDARRTVGVFADPLSFANPTASVGLSAVNGSAGTAMRSDAAPALDQSIAPIWTGVHTHQEDIVMDGHDVDLNGQNLIVDADGDSSISAPTDDEIDIEVGGADIAEWKAGGLYYASAIDAFPNDDGRGIGSRFINQTSLTDWIAHFRNGETTGAGNGTLAAYSWAGAPFSGMPTVGSWQYANEYLTMQATGAGNRHFLYNSITNAAGNWQNKWMYGRFATGLGPEIGLRFDGGSDDDYVELYIDGLGDATYQLKFRYRDNGGAVNTVTSNLIVPVDRLLPIGLYCYHDGANYFALGYVIQETGLTINITGFIHQLDGNWSSGPPVAGRAGIFVKDTSNYGVCDWFENQFT